MAARKAGRPKRIINDEQRRIFLALLRDGVSKQQASDLTRIHRTMWNRLEQKDARFKALVDNAERKQSIGVAPASFDLASELRGVLPTVFYGLRDTALTATGVTKINALIELRKWFNEVDDTAEPYTVTDAQPDKANKKVVNISEAV